MTKEAIAHRQRGNKALVASRAQLETIKCAATERCRQYYREERDTREGSHECQESRDRGFLLQGYEIGLEVAVAVLDQHLREPPAAHVAGHAESTNQPPGLVAESANPDTAASGEAKKVADVSRFRAQGLSDKAIGGRYGVTGAAICQFRKRHGIGRGGSVAVAGTAQSASPDITEH